MSVLAVCVLDTSAKIAENGSPVQDVVSNIQVYFTFLQRKEERKSEVAMDSTLVSSGLTGDDDCKLPIVPVQVKSKKVSNATYGFLDQGSTAVFLHRETDVQASPHRKEGTYSLVEHGPTESCKQSHCLRTGGCWFTGPTFVNCPKLIHRSICLSTGGIFQERGIFMDGHI